MFWLDWKLFGNGWGVASPHLDDIFYWLGGRWYHLSWGLGAQLHSFEWRRPHAGTTRQIANQEFRVLHATRTGPRVMIAWGVVPAPKDASEVDKLLSSIHKHARTHGSYWDNRRFRIIDGV